MALTLLWHINPVEGSVVPRWLSENLLGEAVFGVLFVTCMPTYNAGLLLCGIVFREPNSSSAFDWLPKWLDPFALLLLFLQAIVYFLLGKLVSVCVRRLSRSNKAMPDK